MKNLKYIYFSLLFVFVLTLSFCKKKNNNENKNTSTPEPVVVNTLNEIDNFLNRKATPAQSFTINNNINSTIVTANQSTIEIPSGTFIDTLTFTYPATVTFTVKEAFTIKDFVCNNLTTATTTGDLLNSAGMIYLKTNNGSGNTPLFMIKKLGIKFYSPNTANNILNTQVFNLEPTSNTWQLNTQSGSAVYFDSLIFKNIYNLINISNLGWINCDAFYNCTNMFPGQNYLFKTTGNSTSSNTRVFFVINGMACGSNYTRSSLYCQYVTNSTHDFYSPVNLPNNLNIKAVAISKINNNWFYELKPTTIVQNSNITFNNMQATDSVQLLNFLNGL